METRGPFGHNLDLFGESDDVVWNEKSADKNVTWHDHVDYTSHGDFHFLFTHAFPVRLTNYVPHDLLIIHESSLRNALSSSLYNLPVNAVLSLPRQSSGSAPHTQGYCAGWASKIGHIRMYIKYFPPVSPEKYDAFVQDLEEQFETRLAHRRQYVSSGAKPHIGLLPHTENALGAPPHIILVEPSESDSIGDPLHTTASGIKPTTKEMP
ncbi:hypothetical protein PHLCEN_2v12534 [Hermanssonia centrifuga]|uniref:Uncharacterized protein n=1 Tax=Hermanssonia centrifuga TaxID=98765 RepID=A0A2R6NGS1_9APHY|nr:hypothetical protein PHLCEN_2v12534 [Hermanssonia centrifuga]